MIKFTERECDCCTDSGIPLYSINREYLCINCARDAIITDGELALEFAECYGTEFEMFISELSCKKIIEGLSEEDLALCFADTEQDDLLKDYILEELEEYEERFGPDEDYLRDLAREADYE